MLIHLNKSQLFTVNPAIRFSREYAVSPKIFDELHRRWGIEDFDIDSLCGYLLYKTNKRITPDRIRSWMIKSEVYDRAQNVMKHGVRVVKTEYFGVYEDFVIKELAQNLKSTRALDARSIV